MVTAKNEKWRLHMTKAKKLVLGVALFLGLGFGAVTGFGVPAFSLLGGPVPVAHADGDSCDSIPPPPFINCAPTPTPTPPPN
jgi:hypothetical protein